MNSGKLRSKLLFHILTYLYFSDINKPPVFLNPSQTVTVLEGISIGSSILQPILTDDDVSDTHTFYASYSPPEGVVYFRVDATSKIYIFLC